MKIVFCSKGVREKKKENRKRRKKRENSIYFYVREEKKKGKKELAWGSTTKGVLVFVSPGEG